jgi:hypothetical protein
MVPCNPSSLHMVSSNLSKNSMHLQMNLSICKTHSNMIVILLQRRACRKSR